MNKVYCYCYYHFSGWICGQRAHLRRQHDAVRATQRPLQKHAGWNLRLSGIFTVGHWHRKRRVVVGGGGGGGEGGGDTGRRLSHCCVAEMCCRVIAVWQKCVAESLLYGRNVLPSHCCMAEICCRVIAVWQKCVAESPLCGRNVLPSHCCMAEMCCRIIAVSMNRIVSPV